MKVPHEDFLGTYVPTQEIPIIIDDQEYVLDLSDDTLTVLKAICAQDGTGPELLRLLVNGEPIYRADDDDPNPPVTPVPPADPEALDLTVVREWAKTEGLKPGPRLSAAIIDKYKKAHS